MERLPRRKRLSIHLSDGQVISLTPEIAARFHITPGRSLTGDRVETLAAAQDREDALATALRLVAFRPRSEKEMRQALGRRRVSPELREEIVSRLRELGLLDDRAFAASFVDSRDRSSPRGPRLLAQELRQKGLSREIASESVASIDDADAAYRAAQRGAGAMAMLPYPNFERRLGNFLLRRGFSYETTRATVRRLWQERPNSDGDGTDVPPKPP